MKNLFSWDNPVMKFLGTMADLLILNVMWVIMCLPVVTAGAATVALQYACLKMVRGEDSPFRDFWRSFRVNFKQATLIWLLLLLAALVLAAVGIWLLAFELESNLLVMLIYIVHLVLFLNFCAFLFPVVAQFENSTMKMIKNAFVLSILNFKTAFLSTLLNLIPVIWACVSLESFLRFGFIWLCLGVAVIAFLNTIRIDRVFQKYFESTQDAV